MEFYMNFTKTSFLFLVTSVSLSHLAAKEYTINTPKDGISCTLNTLTQEKMTALIGAFDAFYVTTNVATTNYSSGFFNSGTANTCVSTKIDPFHDAVKNYMAVEVVIKNTTSEILSLSKGEYLEGLENAYVSKEEMVRMLYPQLNEDLNGKYWGCTIGGSLLALLTAGLCVGGIAELERPSGRCGRPDGVVVGVCFGGAFLSLLATIGCFCGASTTTDNLKLSNEKERDVQDRTFFKKFKKEFNQFYSADTSDYEIPAKSEFHDLFFVDLSKVDRNFLANIQPTLVLTSEK
jgi:hypothetical protein